MRRIELIGALATTMALAGILASGCGEDCSGEVRRSIVVSTVDSDGAPIADANIVVEWSDAGDDNWVACEPQEEDVVGSEWYCTDFENAGHFDVRASLGERSALTTGVLVREDNCHVQTRNIDLVLQ